MSKDRDSQWQQQKTDEVSTFEQSGFTHSSTLDSRLGEDRPRQRPSSRRSRHSRKPSWLLLLILMVVLAMVAVLKVVTYLT
jgi:cytoskeletal protein RodZ